jgi:hypothetical protein
MSRRRRDRMHHGPALPKGAGAVRCTECGAVARADGKGSPIVLRHEESCSEYRR